MSTNISRLIDSAILCVEESPTLKLNQDILSRVVLHHKLVTLYGLALKIPPEYRQNLYIYTLPNISPVLPFTALSRECLDKIKTLAAVAAAVAERIESPRLKVLLTRISAILSRSITKDGIHMSKESLIGVLHELDIALTAALTTQTEIP